MGVVANISHNVFPRQGDGLGKRVKLCFNYDTSNVLEATCIRDDRDDPFRTVFQADDGRVFLSVECQYSYQKEKS